MGDSQNFSNLTNILRDQGFNWSNPPSGSSDIRGPVTISYSGQGGSPESVWQNLNKLFMEHNVPYTGPVDLTINGTKNTYQYSGKTQSAGS